MASSQAEMNVFFFNAFQALLFIAERFVLVAG